MNSCYKIIIIILLFFLILSYICSIIFEFRCLMRGDDSKNNTLSLLITDIIITIFIIIVNVYLIYNAFYYFSQKQLYIFLLLIAIILIVKIFILIMIVISVNITLEYSDFNMIVFLTFGQSCFLFILFIFGLVYKCKLSKELDESPLNRVDEFITEDMYKNILTQSLNPNDKKLKKDFKKQFEQRKTESSRISMFNTHN